jgi:glycosyltransferase involved in cell wall biosynthesis
MRILLANSTAHPRIGGVENSLHFIGRELLRAGHEVKVFCFQHSSEEPLRTHHEGVEILRYPYKPVRWPHAQFRSHVNTAQQAIPEILNEFKPDTVWSRSAYVGLGIRQGGYRGSLIQIFSTNAKMNCRGLFLQTHGLPRTRRLMLLALWPSAYLTSSRIERSLASKCKAVAFSENMRSQLLQAYPKDVRQCWVIRPGVDADVFSPPNGEQYLNTIERHYSLHRNEPIVLYVGRLSSAKHIPMLMDAVASLSRHAKLVLVGTGPEENRLKAYAQQVSLTDRVIFAGKHREMLPGFYRISRVCVLPTTTESFGQVLLESLASGTPAIGFAPDGRQVLTATDEIIRDGQTGAVVPQVSASALADKIDWILSLDQTTHSAMARHAREDIQKRFSWNHFVDETLALSFL